MAAPQAPEHVSVNVPMAPREMVDVPHNLNALTLLR